MSTPTRKLPLQGGTLSGKLDFTGTNHVGIVLVSLTTTQRDALTPPTGALIWNSTDSKIQTYNGATWDDVYGTSGLYVATTGDTMTGALEVVVDSSGNDAKNCLYLRGTNSGGAGAAGIGANIFFQGEDDGGTTAVAALIYGQLESATDGAETGSISVRAYSTASTQGIAKLFHTGNLVLGLNTAMPTPPASMTCGYVLANGTAPTGNVTDGISFYSADQAAGNACPHFRTESGQIVKLFTGAALTAADGSALNTGDATSDTVIGNMRTRIAELESRLQAAGIIT